MDKIIDGARDMRQSREKLRKAYAGGDSLLALAKQFDLPPVAIFR